MQMNMLWLDEFTVAGKNDVVQHIYLDDLISESFITLLLFCCGKEEV